MPFLPGRRPTGTLLRMTIRVAHLAAECEPWAKVGGLADVVDALARALGRLPGAGAALELPVDVFLPRYRSVDVPGTAVAEPPLEIVDPRTGAPLAATVLDVPADGFRLRLIDVPAAFDRAGIYGYPDDAWRFAVLGRAALAALRRDPVPPDLLHCHDWHAVPALLERARFEPGTDPFLDRLAVVLTLHNLAYHGWTARDDLGQLGLAPGDPLAGDNPDGLDLLLAGIRSADVVNTVSPGYAREALTPEAGMGLDGALRDLGSRFTGILNGIDPVVWNPAADPALAAAYSRDDPSGKAACRADLLGRLGFDSGDDGVVLGLIGRLDPQKGFDLLAGAMPGFLADGMRVVVLAAGQAELANPLRALALAHPDRVAVHERFDRDLARRIYAGVDLFLMPSRFEPCGQGQMIALRYGTPPVVRRTGGLADSVIDGTASPGDGTGFLFDEPTPDALAGAVGRAVAVRADPIAWAALRRRGMAARFDWVTGPAPRYLAAYRQAIAERRG
jgi:starch synthase